jgi:hypothetical protein
MVMIILHIILKKELGTDGEILQNMVIVLINFPKNAPMLLMLKM